ncbi:hypothetical protein BpHYR1_020866 [Brachionus plicatilis]|uniref:Uncharacterized protein n=1 Tax=Brachionus plicatilis TaxID=10195 RepID=A0A3M7RWS7_BRAPC|nr:hypothetical protein BpHYR1_020866 [Brachionus plicatilis]
MCNNSVQLWAMLEHVSVADRGLGAMRCVGDGHSGQSEQRRRAAVAGRPVHHQSQLVEASAVCWRGGW